MVVRSCETHHRHHRTSFAIAGEDSDEDDEEGEGGDEDDSDDGGDNQKEGDESWGTKKHDFYDADVGDEGDAGTSSEEEEEEEVQRLQAKKRQMMREEDFVDEEFTELLQAEKNKPQSKTAAGKIRRREVMEEEEVEQLEVDMSKLSEADKLVLLEEQNPELLPLLEDFEAKVTDLRERTWPLIERADEIVTEKAKTFLKLKEQILLTYTTNIAFYGMLKANGGLLKDHPVITTLAELRGLIEKMEPIENKLRYQMDKMLNGEAKLPHGMEEDDADVEDELDADKDEDEEDEEDEDEDEEDAEEGEPIPVVTKSKKRKAVDLGDLAAQRLEYTASGPDKTSKAKAKVEKRKAQKLAALGYNAMEDLEGEEDEMASDLSSMRAKMIRQQVMMMERDSQQGVGSRAGDDDLPYHADKKAFANLPRTFQQDDEDEEDEEVDDGFDDDEGMFDFGGPFGPKSGMDEEPDNKDDDEEEDDVAEASAFYEAVRSRTEGRKTEKAEAKAARAYAETMKEADMIEPGQKRGASKKIIANKGLMKYRSKEKKNPRVANKIKAAKKNIKFKHTGNAAANMRDQNQKYAGEPTGVRKNVVKSVKL